MFFPVLFEASHSRSIRRQRGLTQWKEMFNVLHVLINLKLWVNVNLRMVKELRVESFPMFGGFLFGEGI